MAITTDDFNKIWASTSPLTPYEFSESNYKEGWNFVGGTPPSRQMWDFLQKQNDEKSQYLLSNFDNYLPLSGGTLTGVVNGVTPTAGDDSTKLATTAYVQEEIRQHGNLPIGYEYFTFNPSIPQGSLPLFGGEYDRATYSDLWAWVQTQTGYLKTEAEWQTLSTSNNGNVPYYSDGDGSTTFRVPSLKCWVKSANGTVSEVGSYLAAGLPNITGAFGGNDVLNPPQGSFEFISSLNWGGVTPPQSGTMYSISFDASRSSSIYGNATTVQPPSIVGMWLVKAYGVIVDTGSIDEQQYIDDRFNASKQYTDDAVITLNGEISAINTRLGNVISADGSSTTINAEVKLCSATTNEAGLWLIVGFVDLDFTTSSVYNIIIKSGNTTLRICRVPGTNGGGGVNATFRTASQNEEIGLYAQVPSGSGTIRGNLQMLRLA